VFNEERQVFMAQRGHEARNERECWEFPGGSVIFGETLSDAIVREFMEEYGMHIKVLRLLGVVDHLITQEKQHWVSITFIAQHFGGEPQILEPSKCMGIGWFALSGLPEPQSSATRTSLDQYLGDDSMVAQVVRTHSQHGPASVENTK
jgi:8-oxo-dGTP diphosphatase